MPHIARLYSAHNSFALYLFMRMYTHLYNSFFVAAAAADDAVLGVIYPFQYQCILGFNIIIESARQRSN